MPNWVQNNLTIKGDSKIVAACLDLCKSDESAFDFNQIVPMPKELDITESSNNNCAIKYYLTTLSDEEVANVRNILQRVPDVLFGTLDNAIRLTSYPGASIKGNDENKKQWIELAKTLIDNCEKYGFPTWYEWRCHNWGTKWTADCPQIHNIDGETVVSFETAWDCAYPAIRALSEKFPNLSFTISYADEDIGSNCGEYTLIDGVEQPGGFQYDYHDWKDDPALKEKAIEFACDIWGYDPEEYLEDEEDYFEEI